MGKFLGSKLFVIISTAITFVIGMIAGWLLGYQPSVGGFIGQYGGATSTKYVFQIKTACGYWLLAILITLVVLLLCIAIRKLYIGHNSKTETDN